MHKTHQHLDGGRLARAIRPEKAEDFSLGHREGEVGHGDAATVLLAERVRLYGERCAQCRRARGHCFPRVLCNVHPAPSITQPRELDVAEHRVAVVEGHDLFGLFPVEADRHSAELKGIAIYWFEFQTLGRRMFEAYY